MQFMDVTNYETKCEFRSLSSDRNYNDFKVDIVVNIICKIINVNRICMADLIVFCETS